MATKTAPVAQPEATDAREEGPDAPLLDTLGAELKKLVQKGKERGYEAGKEPKKSALEPPAPWFRLSASAPLSR